MKDLNTELLSNSSQMIRRCTYLRRTNIQILMPSCGYGVRPPVQSSISQKTQIIPVAYREKVVETRRISTDQPPLPDHVHIAKDGTATRILGAWLGNAVDQISVWTPTIEKLREF